MFEIFNLSNYTKYCQNENIQYGMLHFHDRCIKYHVFIIYLVIMVDCFGPGCVSLNKTSMILINL